MLHPQTRMAIVNPAVHRVLFIQDNLVLLLKNMLQLLSFLKTVKHGVIVVYPCCIYILYITTFGAVQIKLELVG